MQTTIKIDSKAFTIETPYAAGHTLTEIEAKVLNRTFAENVGNNMRKTVKEYKGTDDELAAEVAKYAAEYSFAERAAAGSSGPRLDPVEREATNLIIEALKQNVVAKGENPKDYDAKAFKDKAASIMAEPAKREKWLAKAQKVLDQRRKAAADLADLLD